MAICIVCIEGDCEWGIGVVMLEVEGVGVGLSFLPSLPSSAFLSSRSWESTRLLAVEARGVGDVEEVGGAADGIDAGKESLIAVFNSAFLVCCRLRWERMSEHAWCM